VKSPEVKGNRAKESEKWVVEWLAIPLQPQGNKGSLSF